MKIALVHDWLLRIGGAERVFKTLHGIFPEADIYTLFYDQKFVKEFLPGTEIQTTFLQKIPGITKLYKLFLLLMPTAIESLDLSAYDVVISSSVAFSKGLVLKPKTTHICYCHSPTRFLWDWQINYVKERGYKLLKPWVLMVQHWLRIWDSHAAQRPDYFIANSKHTQKRIWKYYSIDSKVIYPPVEMPIGVPKDEDGGYYLIVSQLLPHKNIEVAIDAFNKLGLPLFIIGEGPLKRKLKRMADKNIRILGYQNDEEIEKLYQECRAFILPQEEEFGITPIEAMFRGKPVLALRRGGALEYVLESLNGEFFDDAVPEVLADGVRRLNANYPNYSPLVIKKSVQKFRKGRFINEIREFIRCLTDNQKLI